MPSESPDPGLGCRHLPAALGQEGEAARNGCASPLPVPGEEKHRVKAAQSRAQQDHCSPAFSLLWQLFAC